MNPVIFYEGIVEPPSESLALRALYLQIRAIQKKQNAFILETKKENKDLYYKWLKQTHLWDFVHEIVSPEEEVYGLRISATKKKQPCLIVDRVSWDNIHQIISRSQYVI